MARGFGDPLGMLFNPKMMKEQLATAGGGALFGGAFIGAVGLITHHETRMVADPTDASGKKMIAAKDDKGNDIKDEAYFFNKRWKRGALAIALGILGGGVAWHYGKRNVAAGIAGAAGSALSGEVVGYALAERRAAQELAQKDNAGYRSRGPAMSLGDGRDPEATLERVLAGAGMAQLPEEQQLAASSLVEQERRAGAVELAASSGTIEERSPNLGQFLAGNGSY